MDRVSSSECSQGEDKLTHRTPFEEAYPRYEFAELVRLALAMGAWLVDTRRRVQRPGPDVSSDPLPGERNPAA